MLGRSNIIVNPLMVKYIPPSNKRIPGNGGIYVSLSVDNNYLGNTRNVLAEAGEEEVTRARKMAAEEEAESRFQE
jgi:hypothetical protein